MYTNISGEKTVSMLLEILEREYYILGAERIRKESLTRLINLTVRINNFTFNGSIYEQIFELPMGSPLSPLSNCMKPSLQSSIFMRYLDDYFALCSHGKINLGQLLNFIDQLDD
ncbi:unnamed protein product [Protopolystoma xenopodis]|uniref:Reverse transcriptase domain-containing protein n=1 Tax=Protopolystoma xenopodis TaxID=117903 RepID=A0A448WVH8_9PLAT|nr:unnamed protein product [Protopolystoma xenopodis]